MASNKKNKQTDVSDFVSWATANKSKAAGSKLSPYSNAAARQKAQNEYATKLTTQNIANALNNYQSHLSTASANRQQAQSDYATRLREQRTRELAAQQLAMTRANSTYPSNMSAYTGIGSVGNANIKDSLSGISYGINDTATLQKKLDDYSSVINNADFGANSEYVSTKNGKKAKATNGGVYAESGYNDLTYELVNKNQNAKKIQEANDIAGLTNESSHYDDMTDDQIKIYNYLYKTQGAENAKEYADLVSEYKPLAAESAMTGALANLVGITNALGTGAASLAGDQDTVQKLNQGYNKFLNLQSAAQENNKTAYQVGQTAESLAEMAALGGVTGAATSGIANPFLRSALNGAGTFGAMSALDNAGYAAAGLMSGKEYAKEIGLSTAGGAVGGVASTATGMAAEKIISKFGLENNNFVRTILNDIDENGNPFTTESTSYTKGKSPIAAKALRALSGVAFVGGDQAVRYASDPENYQADLTSYIVAYAFGIMDNIGRTTEPTFSTEYRGTEAYDEWYNANNPSASATKPESKYFADCNTFEEAKAKMREYAKQYHPDNAGDGDILSEINAEYGQLKSYFKNNAANVFKTAQEAAKSGDTETYEEAKKELLALIEDAKEDVVNGATTDTEQIEAINAVDSIVNGMDQDLPTEEEPVQPVKIKSAEERAADISIVENFADQMDLSGKSVMTNFYDGSLPAAAYVTAMNRYYQAGFTGKDITDEDVSTADQVGITEPARQAAYQAGQIDATRYEQVEELPEEEQLPFMAAEKEPETVEVKGDNLTETIKNIKEVLMNGDKAKSDGFIYSIEKKDNGYYYFIQDTRYEKSDWSRNFGPFDTLEEAVDHVVDINSRYKDYFPSHADEVNLRNSFNGIVRSIFDGGNGHGSRLINGFTYEVSKVGNKYVGTITKGDTSKNITDARKIYTSGKFDTFDDAVGDLAEVGLNNRLYEGMEGEQTNGKRSMEEVPNEPAVSGTSVSSENAGRVLGGVSSENDSTNGEGQNLTSNTGSKRGADGGLRSGADSEQHTGGRSSGNDQGAGVRTSTRGSGELTAQEEKAEAKAEEELSSKTAKEIVEEPAPEEAVTEEQQVEQKSVLATQEDPRGTNFIFAEKGGVKIPTTEKARFKANVDAIKTLQNIIAEDRKATPAEQELLATYTGWGGLTNAFEEKNWPKEFKVLKNLLSEEDYKKARSSITDAYFTEPKLIRSIYNGLAKIGFNGGRLLEPSAGTGRFIGSMPESMLDGVRSFTAIELDPTAGNIAKYMYPKADVRVQGFETAKLVDNYMDLVIGNVPFGTTGIADKRYPKSVTSLIHNYFIARSIDTVRPGGVVCVITSSGTMNSNTKDARQYFASKVDLIGAIRLPNTAFQSTGTPVVTDILVFKKRESGKPYSGENFIETQYADLSDRVYGTTNEYFIEHPEMVLGVPERVMGRYGADITYSPSDSRYSLETQIERAFGKINAKMEYPTVRTHEDIKAEIKAAGNTKEGSTIHKNGKFYRNTNGSLEEISVSNGKQMLGVITVRDTARELLNLQQDGASAEDISAKRKELNNAYDDFVKKFGPLHKQANKKAILEDADYPFILALETYDTKTKVAGKAAIFTKDVVGKRQSITHTNTVAEGLTVSMNELGYVNINRIAELTGEDPSYIETKLTDAGQIFKNKYGQYEIAEVYLSGNVKAKLRDAEALADGDPSYKKNVEALKEIIPADIAAEDIGIRMGANWIPDEVYSNFASGLMSGRKVNVNYIRETGSYVVEANDYYTRNSAESTIEYGTKRYPFIGNPSLLEAILNNRDIKVYDKVGDNQRVLNHVETSAAQERAEKIQTEFKKWLWSDSARKITLSKLYNDIFNNTVTPKYDGSNLTIDGLSAGYSLREHQLNAVQRIINSGGNTLLAHRVGAGKTLEMAAAAMKLRQLGIVKKPMFVVPKHIHAQWSNEFFDYFPAAKLLSPGENDFSPANRKTFTNKIAVGDYDAVIITYEQFEKLPMSQKFQEEFYQEQIDALEQAIIAQREAQGKSAPSVRNLETSKKSLETKLKNLASSKKDENNIAFEELGVDSLFVDEAHNFKNLFYSTKMQGVSDLGNKNGAQRSFDLYMKVRYLQKLNGGRGVVFATATPVMNSVVEMYTMQRYLQTDALESKGLVDFDAWANEFGDVKSVLKIKASGSGYEIKQSLSRYKNLPELQQMFRSFADVIVDAADLPYLNIPGMKGGKRIVVECEPGDFQKEEMQRLAERAEALKKAGKSSDDHIFKIMGDGKKVSYSQKMIDPSLPYEPNGKIMSVAKNVVDVFNRTSKEKGAQLIFCDRGVPGGTDAERGINIYEDIKNLLVADGIPADQIAFIHDADSDVKKSTLFDKVREGKVRVLIGSSAKMGTGVNVQKRIAAIHEMNPVDRPGDLEQNEGRALRQGNMFNEVETYVYITNGTFDSRQWDNIKRKGAFINQVLSGNFTGRESDGDGELVLSAAEISAIASGNPLILEQFEVSSKIANLENLEKAHTKEVANAKARIAESNRLIESDTELIANYKEDVKKVRDMSGDKFNVTIGGKNYTERKAAGTEIIKAGKKIREAHKEAAQEEKEKIGTFSNFDLYVTSNGDMLLKGANEYRSSISFDSETGTATKLSNTLEKIKAGQSAVSQRLEETKSSISKLEAIANTTFDKEEELKEARAREREISQQLNPENENIVIDDTNIPEDSGETDKSIDRAAGFPPRPDQWKADRVGAEKKPEDVLSITDILAKIRHDFGINITSGHIRGAGVKGEYSRNNPGIKTRGANDLVTANHEFGHWLDQQYGIREDTLPKELKEELESVLEDDFKAGYSKDKWYTEGIAEYMRNYFQNREVTAIKWPKFTKYLKEHLSPKDLVKIDELADEINAYFSRDIIKEGTKSIRLKEEGPRDFRTPTEKIHDTSTEWYQAWVDSKHAIERFDREYGTKAYIYASNASYADGIAARIITGDLVNRDGHFVGNSLKAALNGINTHDKKEYKEFNEYLVNLHGPEWLERGYRVYADDRENSTNYMVLRNEYLDKKYPQFKAAAERVINFVDLFNQTWAVNYDLISQELYDRMRDLYPNYVPFNRALDKGKPNTNGKAKKGFANQNTTARFAKGDGHDVISPVDNIIDMVIKTVNVAVRNSAMMQIRNQAVSESGVDAKWIEKIPAPMVAHTFDTTKIKDQLSDSVINSVMTGDIETDAANDFIDIINELDNKFVDFSIGKANGDIVTVLVKGKKEFWKVNDPELLESLLSISTPKLPATLEAYSKVTRFLTANITGNNPIWSIFSNAPRDIESLAFYSKTKNPVKLASAISSAYLNAIKNAAGASVDPYFHEYISLGGGNVNYISADVNYAKKARKKLTDSLGSKALDTINPINWIEFITNTIEMGPRFATYKVCRKAGLSEQEAFYEACDITVNFRRAGVNSRSVGAVVPFFNASVQGLDKFTRYYSAADVHNKSRGKVAFERFSIYCLANILLGGLMYALNNGDEESTKNYQMLSTYTKNTYFCIPLGDGKYFCIPKARELSVLTSLTERILEKNLGGNDHAFDEFYSYAADNFLPSIVSDIAELPGNIAKDGAQAGLIDDTAAGIVGSLGMIGVFANMVANRDFLGRAIESSSLEDYLPKDRYTGSTSKVAKTIGEYLNLSPQMIDYFGNNVLGYWWKFQKALAPVDESNQDKTLGVKNTYVKDNLYSTDIVNRLYDRKDASELQKNSNGSVDDQITYTNDNNMTTFYSRFYSLNKNSNTDSSRYLRKNVLTMISDYLDAAESGTTTKLQQAVYDLVESTGDTSYLPSVMQTSVNDADGNNYSLTDKQYYEYQTSYNDAYWSYIESNYNSNAKDSKKSAVVKAAKEVAKERATNDILNEVAKESDGYFDKYDGISDEDLIEFKSELDLANDDGSLKQTEVKEIIWDMVNNGLSYEDASTLFRSKYSSDKNNDWN